MATQIAAFSLVPEVQDCRHSMFFFSFLTPVCLNRAKCTAAQSCACQTPSRGARGTGHQVAVPARSFSLAVELPATAVAAAAVFSCSVLPQLSSRCSVLCTSLRTGFISSCSLISGTRLSTRPSTPLNTAWDASPTQLRTCASGHSAWLMHVSQLLCGQPSGPPRIGAGMSGGGVGCSSCHKLLFLACTIAS